MPFEHRHVAPRNIAVIGGGISGMGAAHALARNHSVTVFEAGHRLGGHARTIIAGKNADQPVDTGFIVFNYANYPRLVSLFEDLDVPVIKSDMSFGASLRGGALEYGTGSFPALFAQKRNALHPKFLRMLRDIVHFNAHALDTAEGGEMTIRHLLARLGTGAWFRDYYLLPLSGAIWSTPKDKILDFPAEAMMRFFENHALLHHTGQHQWYTVDGGSVEYVTRLEQRLMQQGVEIRLNAPVQTMRRTPEGVEIVTPGALPQMFDEVVLATHSDDSLAMLSDATPREKADLGAIRYQPNDIVLHADASVMPRRKSCWSSWVYTETETRTRPGQIDLTYWMNSLQPIPKDDPHFVTLNSRRPIREELIYDQVTLRHPVFDVAALQAQTRVKAQNGTNRTWFCGAWLNNGFHEDGLQSAFDVAEAIEARDRIGMSIAAE